MSEDTTEDVTTASDETAFLVVKRHDGSFFATADFGDPVHIDRVATRTDIKAGCRDILDIIQTADQANMVAGMILDILKPKEVETVAGSIREALDERGIL